MLNKFNPKYINLSFYPVFGTKFLENSRNRILQIKTKIKITIVFLRTFFFHTLYAKQTNTFPINYYICYKFFLILYFL